MSGVIEMITKILQFIFGTNLGKEAADILTEYQNLEAIKDWIGKFDDVLLPIASVLVSIYFIMALADKVSSDNFSTDQFISLCIKLVISIAVINNATELAKIIAEFGTKFTEAIGDIANVASTTELTEAFQEAGFIETIVMVIIAIIPALFAMIIRLILYFMIFGYVLEIEVRSALAPLGFADFVIGGANSNGMRYLKKLIALGIQGGLIVIALSAGTALMSGIVDTLLTGIDLSVTGIMNLIFSPTSILKLLGVQMAMVGLVGSSKSIANEVIG